MKLSGERFTGVYRLRGDLDAARAAAWDLCVEQTVEYPADLIAPGPIRAHILGRVESLRALDEAACEARISFAVETAGGELTQLLNVLFGNISLKPGIRLDRLELSPSLLARYAGPRFGRAGLRARLGTPHRPLLCSALKPMGLSPEALASLAARLARGGVDLVKDDHGLADQPFCRFEERVSRCAGAVAEVNAREGTRCLYAPNITGPADQVLARARHAAGRGAGALLIAPGLVGFDALRQVADDDAVALPILSHPALLGTYVLSPDSGVSHFALFGQILRLAGADASIFPHHGGRFSFSADACRDLARGTSAAMGTLRPIFPVPAGGMSLDRVAEIVELYGPEVMLLIGGDLHRGGDLTDRCRRFREAVEAAWPPTGCV